MAEIPLLFGQKDENPNFWHKLKKLHLFRDKKPEIPINFGQKGRNDPYFGAKLQKFP